MNGPMPEDQLWRKLRDARKASSADQMVADADQSASNADQSSFDPIIRYGGDQFVCGLGSTDIVEAQRRFDLIGIAVEADAGVGISVGLAELEPAGTADGLTQRADDAMLAVRAARHSAL